MDSSTMSQSSTSYMPYWCCNTNTDSNNNNCPTWCPPGMGWYGQWGNCNQGWWGNNNVDPNCWYNNCYPTNCYNPCNPCEPCPPSSDRAKKIKILRSAGIDDLLDARVNNKAAFLGLFSGKPSNIVDLLNDNLINKLYTDGITANAHPNNPTEPFRIVLAGAADKNKKPNPAYDKLVDLLFNGVAHFESEDKYKKFLKSGIRHIKNHETFAETLPHLLVDPLERSRYYRSGGSYNDSRSYAPYTRNYAGCELRKSQSATNYYS